MITVGGAVMQVRGEFGEVVERGEIEKHLVSECHIRQVFNVGARKGQCALWCLDIVAGKVLGADWKNHPNSVDSTFASLFPRQVFLAKVAKHKNKYPTNPAIGPCCYRNGVAPPHLHGSVKLCRSLGSLSPSDISPGRRGAFLSLVSSVSSVSRTFQARYAQPSTATLLPQVRLLAEPQRNARHV